ncbi:MAG: hypothetical protein IKZ19_07780, partial [Clostridia bacterium]|nr:hypothetical protein [Clostridia bacterium]
MRERLIAYVSELTSGRRDREAVIEKALRRYDSELAAGKGPEEALGFAMATLEKERELRAEPQPKPAPAVQRPRELVIGENRWKLRGALRAVRVNYSYGKIRLESHKGSEILLREKNLAEDSEPARFVFEKGILTVEFTGKKPVRRIVDSIRDAIMPRRTLEILVPEGPASGLMEIKLSSQSADFSVSRISSEVFECETASGDVKL